MHSRRRTTVHALTAATILAFLGGRLGAQPSQPTLDERLARMVERLEEKRVQTHVPGMAIAVIKDGSVVLARGFGVADVERETPVTDETIFAVGSTTKAFTATLCGMLVDDGRMSWDDPVRTHLPDYRLMDPEANEKVVIRDLLCHRIGLASMTVLWYGNDVTQDEVLAVSYGAELLNPFRKEFGYSNVSYLAAGHAAGRAAGRDWHTLLAERIFAPLGMTSSNTSIEAALADPRTAKGYIWNDEESRLDPHPLRNVEPVAPAGAINSNVRDMAQWVRLQLGRGEIDGRRLLSPEQHAETWTKHIDIRDGIDYGLGWFLREWDGRRVIEHAGGIDGFTAEVAMIPDENVGFVLLMNLFASPLQEASREIVFDSLLGEPTTEDVAAKPDEDFDDYVGTYIGDFGPFQGAEFEVLVQNGSLAIDVPGQMIFEMDPPGEDGKRPFSLFGEIALRFNEDGEGDVYSLTIFQSGYAFELPRKGVELPVEIDLDEVRRKYVGTYRFEERDADVRALIQNNRLAIDVPKQMAFELYPPDEEGRWRLRAKDSLWVRFEVADDGRATSLTMIENGNEHVLPRIETAETDPLLPTVEDVMAMVHRAHGARHLAAGAAFRGRGSARLVHVGLEGTITALFDRNRIREDLEFGRFGRIRSAFNGERGWLDSAFTGVIEVKGDQLEDLQLSHPLLLMRDWSEAFEEIAVLRNEDLDGRSVHVVQAKPRQGPAITIWVDATSGLIAGTKIVPMSALGPRVAVTVRYGDHRDVGGVLLPFRVEAKSDLAGTMLFQYESIGAGVTLPDDAFSFDPGDAGPP